MRVLVHLYGDLRQALSQKEMVAYLKKGTTLEGLLHHLAKKLERRAGDEGAGLQRIMGGNVILVNGRHHNFTGGLKTVLVEDTVVDVIPPLLGG